MNKYKKPKNTSSQKCLLQLLPCICALFFFSSKCLCEDTSKQAYQLILPKGVYFIPVRLIPHPTSPIYNNNYTGSFVEPSYSSGECVISSKKTFEQHNVKWIEIESPYYGWIEAKYLKSSAICTKGMNLLEALSNEADNKCVQHEKYLSDIKNNKEEFYFHHNFTLDNEDLKQWVYGYLAVNILVDYTCSYSDHENKTIKQIHRDDIFNNDDALLLFKKFIWYSFNKESNAISLTPTSNTNEVMMTHVTEDIMWEWTFRYRNNKWQLIRVHTINSVCD